MDAFQYYSPTSLAEVTGLLVKGGGGARVLAGGTDLMVQMRGGSKTPQLVVDIKKIPETNVLELNGQGLRLGAAVSCWDISLRDDIRAVYPGLMEALELIGSMQIQGRATVGGNLCNASPAADTTPALMALNAQCLIAGPGGERRLAVEQFVTGPGATRLGAGEFLLALEIPRPASNSADAYQRFTPRNEMDIAVVGAAANLTLNSAGICTAARIALGAVAPTVLLVPAIADLLLGSAIDEPLLAKAARLASQAGSPISDKRGTAEYRRRIAGVLTRRVIQTAANRAAGGV